MEGRETSVFPLDDIVDILKTWGSCRSDVYVDIEAETIASYLINELSERNIKLVKKG